MWPSALASFRNIIQDEGYTTWMYIDTRGLVTIGRGDLIDPIELAHELDWVVGVRNATPQEVIRDWNIVKSRQDLKNRGGQSVVFGALTTVRLTASSIDRIVQKTINCMWSVLKTRLPDIETWPADAQEAILRWAWGNGPNAHYPLMFGALATKNFRIAAIQSDWTGEQGETRTIITKLFNNAADSILSKADPSILIGV